MLDGRWRAKVERALVPVGHGLHGAGISADGLTVLLTEQALAGAVKPTVKFAEARGARLATASTVLGVAWVSTTDTLVSVIFPELLTVPL